MDGPRTVVVTPAPPVMPADVLTDMRVGMYPAFVVIFWILTLLLVLGAKFAPDAIESSSKFIVIGIGAFQVLLSIFWVFSWTYNGKFLQILFIGVATMAYGFAADKRLFGKFICLAAIINFFCLIGKFPFLGWSSSSRLNGSVYFEDVVSGYGPFDMGACPQYWNYEFEDDDPRKDPSSDEFDPLYTHAQCYYFLNLLTFSAFTLACLQPMLAFASYFSFSADDEDEK